MRSLLDLHFAFLWIYIHTSYCLTFCRRRSSNPATGGGWRCLAQSCLKTNFCAQHMKHWYCSTSIILILNTCTYVMYRMTHLLSWSMHGSAGVEVSELNGTNTFLIMVDHSRMARDFLRLSVPCFQKPRLCIEHGRTQSPRNPSGMDVFTSNFYDGCLLQVMIKGSL